MSIIFDEEKKIFLLNTEHTSYAFGISVAGLPVNLHWGGRIDRLEDLPAPEESTWFSLSHYCSRAKQSRLEYSFYSPGFHYEPCLKLSAPDCALAPHYAGYRLEGENHLTVELVDESVGLRFLLHYELHSGAELLGRRVEVVNEGVEAVRLENLFSAVWSLPRGRAPRLTTMLGEWGQEYQVHRAVVEPGERVLESRNGISGHTCVPFFAFDPGNADECSGAVSLRGLDCCSLRGETGGRVRIAAGGFENSISLSTGFGRCDLQRSECRAGWCSLLSGCFAACRQGVAGGAIALTAPVVPFARLLWLFGER